jgi:hypothetical protein
MCCGCNKGLDGWVEWLANNFVNEVPAHLGTSCAGPGARRSDLYSGDFNHISIFASLCAPTDSTRISYHLCYREDQLLTCSVCGGDRFDQKVVLWDELAAQWRLSPGECPYIDLQ